MFNQNKIKGRVMAAINQKLKEAEASHKEACIKIDEEAEIKKNKHADEMVQSIIGKIM